MAHHGSRQCHWRYSGQVRSPYAAASLTAVVVSPRRCILPLVHLLLPVPAPAPEEERRGCTVTSTSSLAAAVRSASPGPLVPCSVRATQERSRPACVASTHRWTAPTQHEQRRRRKLASSACAGSRVPRAHLTGWMVFFLPASVAPILTPPAPGEARGDARVGVGLFYGGREHVP